MRKILTSMAALAALTATASAADLPRRALQPVPAPLPVFTWTGAYFGLNAGYITTTQDTADTAGTLVSRRAIFPSSYTSTIPLPRDGFTGGGQVGYTCQLTPGSGFVVGVEADAAYTDLKRTRSFQSKVIGNNT